MDMDFIDKLRQFSTKALRNKDVLVNEDATKNALVMPFFQLLGYDVFDPLEFVPEYTATFGVKKDARVDYAIIIDDAPVILVECKPCNESLEKHSGQLAQYYAATTPAKFGILTNGIIYQFYTDLNETNIMDREPFFTFDLLNLNESMVPELKRFARDTLDIPGAFNAAAEMKYMGKIKALLETLRTDPSDDVVAFVMKEISAGKATSKAKSEFRPIIKRGFAQYINEAISETLKSAMKRRDEIKDTADSTPAHVEPIIEEDHPIEDDSPMTMEEFEGFIIVKSVLRDMIDINRLAYRHTQKYMAVLLDDNKNKRICRFWFNREKKFITTPNENNVPVKRDINGLNDIYQYSDYIKEVCKRYI